jgi:cell migration-inducing and hyaluronan-binding protein
MRKMTDAESCRSFLWLRHCGLIITVALGFLAMGLVTPGRAQVPQVPQTCDGTLPEQGLTIGGAGQQPDLLVEHTCKVLGSKYYFRHVRIVKDGKLIFIEPPSEPSSVLGQDFWATSIIIENHGAILAGVDDQKPYGTNGKTLTFHLYGADPRGTNAAATEGPGESCSPIKDKTNFADCGIPLTDWDSNGKTEIALPGKVTDYFYQYGNFHGDSGKSAETGQAGHFGYKVLALSYGGTLQLRGLKGTTGTSAADITTLLKSPGDLKGQADDAIITNSGTDWVRLAAVEKGAATLTLARPVRGQGDWQPGDEIVVTTTDYFPEHSELRMIAPPDTNQASEVVKVTTPLVYEHSSTPYDVGTKIGADKTAFRTAVETADGGSAAYLDKAETRAAVALLTRSIRIVSEGDKAGDTLKDATEGRAKTDDKPKVDANPNYMYGGHVVFRQGFEKLQIQGVEFKQLG